MIPSNSATNVWVMRILEDDLLRLTNLPEEKIRQICAEFMDTLCRRRHAVLPVYLSDEMFDAQRAVDQDIAFSNASRLYSAAVRAYHERLSTIDRNTNIEDRGCFW